MTITQRNRGLTAGIALLFALATASGAAAAANVPTPGTNLHPCWQASASFQPPDCSYVGAVKTALLSQNKTMAELMAIPSHKRFICRHNPKLRDCRVAGGVLAGHVEEFTSELVLEFHGAGTLEGFSRTVVIPNVMVEVHSGPPEEGAEVQDVETEMVRVQGDLPPGDPDFAELSVVGGTHNGYPSPGRMVITPDGDGYRFDSHFDVSYTIRFVGAEGSALEGREGTVEGTTRMTAYAHPEDGGDAAP
ncbi:MAG TPA: hypothetical protein VHQ65_14550 [Thermoanaerobaculia bacterium]|nr:hypothetical protein [Thermoanaerobaculia bacterium]